MMGMPTSSREILEKSQLSGQQAKAIPQVMEFELSAQADVQVTKSDVNAVSQLGDVGSCRSVPFYVCSDCHLTIRYVRN